MDHLRYSGLPFDAQRAAFLDIVSRCVAEDALGEGARSPCRLAGGFRRRLYNTVWNQLTGKPSGYGIKDVDLFYFDESDLSYEAEDGAIAAAAPVFAELPLPVEVRNQARVHLWYPLQFGQPCPRYTSSSDSVRHFASKTHAVGVRFDADGQLDLVAPFGLDDIFSFRITPNRVMDNRQTHETKGARAKANWPEITVLPW